MDNSLIKHQAAIDAWRADFKGYVDCLDLPRDDYNGIMEYINEAPSAQPEQAAKGCRNCKYGKYNDHWKTHFCYNPNECTEWNLWEPSAQPEITLESAIDYLHKIGWMQEHDRILTESAQPGITKEYNLKKIYNIYVKIAQAHFVYQPSKPKTITAMPFDWIETQNLLEKYLEDHVADFDALCREYVSENAKDGHLPPAQPDIKQAAKLLSDFIESCPGGDSYLITPNGENLITDWGYATEGIQLIHDWAERRTDETD